MSAHLAVVLKGKVKGETGDTFCFGSCHNFEVLDDTGVTLVLQPRVFTLGVFTYDREIDVGMTSGESRQRLAKYNRGIDVKLLTHGDIPGDMTRL